MGKVRDFFIPCAKRLDNAFHENMEAITRARAAILQAPKMMVEAVRSLPHNEIEAVANHIRQITGTERREHDRPKQSKPAYAAPRPQIHRDFWMFGS